MIVTGKERDVKGYEIPSQSTPANVESDCCRCGDEAIKFHTIVSKHASFAGEILAIWIVTDIHSQLSYLMDFLYNSYYLSFMSYAVRNWPIVVSLSIILLTFDCDW